MFFESKKINKKRKLNCSDEQKKVREKLYLDIKAFIEKNYIPEEPKLFEASARQSSPTPFMGMAMPSVRMENKLEKKSKKSVCESLPEPLCEEKIYVAAEEKCDVEKTDYIEAEIAKYVDNCVEAEINEYADNCDETDIDEDELSKILDERIKHSTDTFSEYLMHLINLKKLDPVEVYKDSLVDKKVFSKIRNSKDYHPKKLTVLCLCVGAHLNLDESKDLLARAGYAFSPCSKTDIIFQYFIENKIYDIYELDIQLDEHGLPSMIA